MQVERPLTAFLGVPRGGTLWTTSLMRACGLDIGHENMGTDGTCCGFAAWTGEARQYPVKSPIPIRKQKPGPFVFHNLFHVCRHPLSTMKTLPHIFERADSWRVWFGTMGMHVPVPWDSRVMAMKYWNATRERLIWPRIPIIRIDRLSDDWTILVKKLGLPKTIPQVPCTNSLVPRWTPTWDDLFELDAKEAEKMQKLARIIGYKLEPPPSKVTIVRR